ncbi:class C sortase [Olsenella uli]|uniref:class C sortase n=1 Tax=Olsenella uli TaxID=133926 RepID=UPI0012AB92DA|nr:class C sortase [Olsenella uli]
MTRANGHSSTTPDEPTAAAQPAVTGDTPAPDAASARAPRRKSRLSRLLPFLGLALGLAILLYYPATEAWDSWRRAQVTAQLDHEAAQFDDSAKQELLAQAIAYNRYLAGLTPDIPADQIWPYEHQLSEDGHGTAFGYVVIPKIGLKMSVYHGTSVAVLSAGVGHVENSSLPVGGDTTHTVLSAHSGLAQMRAFDDIRLLEEGDVFGVVVLGDVYCYRVTSIEVVLPDEVESVQIRAGEDLATLVTCTPYGINDHRLLVHGTRTKVPDGFLSEGPSVTAIVTNRRLWPAAAGTAVAVAVVVGGIVRQRRRRKAARASAEKGAAEKDAPPATTPPADAQPAPSAPPADTLHHP